MQAKSTSGVYAIVHIASGRVYIGSSSTIEKRWAYHRSALSRRTHENTYLTHAWHKYGADAFVFKVIEAVQVSALIQQEQYWIDQYRATDRRHGFNISPVAGSTRGYRPTPEVRAKWSTAQRGRKRSKESIERSRLNNIGKHTGDPLIGMRTRSLTNELALAIKKRLAEGITATQASQEFSVSTSTIWRLAKGKTYAEIAPELNDTIRVNRPQWRSWAKARAAKKPNQTRLASGQFGIGHFPDTP